MILKGIVVEDELSAKEALSQLLQLYHPNIELCTCTDSLPATVTAIKLHTPDIVFLDVELGSESGFDLFRHFPNPDFKVIFITAHEHYAMQAFRFAALDYLCKPINPAMLAEALQKTSNAIDLEQTSLKMSSFVHNMQHAAKQDKKLVLKTVDSVHLVTLGEIVYCEADSGYTYFHLADKSRIIVSKTMGNYESLLQDCDFFRIHQSYLLNLNYFKRYEKADGGKAVLKNNLSLPVATRKKDQLLQKLAELQ